MKILTATMISMISLNAFAAAFDENHPVPFQGVHLVPHSYFATTVAEEKEIARHDMEIKKYGAAQECDVNAKEMIAMYSTLKVIPHGAKLDDSDTNLRPSYADIHLIFHYKNDYLTKKSIKGYAPAGTYLNDRGWTGLAAMFDDPLLGKCEYTVMSLNGIGGGINLDESKATYIINGKRSLFSSNGKDDCGYEMSMNWIGQKINSHELVCDTDTNNSKNKGAFIDMAKQIDSSEIIT